MRRAVTAIASLAFVAVLGTTTGSANGAARTAAVTPQLIGCNVSSSAIPFPQYNPLSATPSTFSGMVTLSTCIGIGVTISLGAGGANSFAPRRMASGASTINYNLYQDSGMTIVWGDGTGATKSVTETAAIGTVNIPIYGNVPGAQIVPAGTYSDAVTVTVNTAI